jgi:7 transmembrane receptor (rhodopsin family)
MMNLSAKFILGSMSLLILVFAIIVVTNVVVIKVICVNKKLRKPANYGIVSISLADLLFVVYSAVQFGVTIHCLINEENLSRNFCNVVRAFGAFFYALQLFTPVAVAVDRFIAICHPLKYYKLNKAGLTKWILVSCWIFATVFGSLCLLQFAVMSTHEYDVLCLPQDMGAADVYVGCMLQLTCILTIVVLYIRIFQTIRNQVRGIISSKLKFFL